MLLSFVYQGLPLSVSGCSWGVGGIFAAGSGPPTHILYDDSQASPGCLLEDIRAEDFPSRTRLRNYLDVKIVEVWQARWEASTKGRTTFGFFPTVPVIPGLRGHATLDHTWDFQITSQENW